MGKTHIRPASLEDRGRISSFLDSDITIHHHLDWRTPLDWLGTQPFLLLESENRLQAVLVCPPDPPLVYWLRVFAAARIADLESCWQALHDSAWKVIQRESGAIMASLAYQPWIIPLLEKNSWQVSRHVVQLRWLPTDIKMFYRVIPSSLSIRRMRQADILKVADIDQACFEPTWRHSANGLACALEQSDYATVAEWDGEMIGFQLTTSHQSRVHLARLAVLPQKQGLHIGREMVLDMLKRYRRPWVREITVNTQHDNQRSLNLYHDLGFIPTGDQFPIYIRRS